jgi:hypothetical protein
MSVFGSVVVVAFQIAFRAEIHVNDFFYFLKIIFNINTSKRYKKYKPHSILSKKKKIQNLTKCKLKRTTKQARYLARAKVLCQILRYEKSPSSPQKNKIKKIN